MSVFKPVSEDEVVILQSIVETEDYEVVKLTLQAILREGGRAHTNSKKEEPGADGVRLLS